MKTQINWKALTTLLTFTALWGCSEDGSNNQPKEAKVRPIKYYNISESTAQKKSQFPAKITAANTSELSFQVAGQIIEFDLKESDKVNEAQVIAKLDDKDYRNQFNALKAQYDNAVTEYQRSENLLKENAIAKNVVEQRKSQMEVLKAQLDVAQEALNDTVLRAPYSGTVSNVTAENFQNIQPLQPIATIINEKALEANVNIPASILSQSPNKNIVSAILTFDSLPNLEIPATFKEIALTADSNTQTYLVKFQFEAPTDALILPGMNGNLTVTANSKDDSSEGAILVPISAIQSGSENEFVWLVDTINNTVSKRVISVETAVGDMIPVSSGLEVGDVIAAAGGAYLSEGMQVKEWVQQ